MSTSEDDAAYSEDQAIEVAMIPISPIPSSDESVPSDGSSLTDDKNQGRVEFLLSQRVLQGCVLMEGQSCPTCHTPLIKMPEDDCDDVKSFCTDTRSIDTPRLVVPKCSAYSGVEDGDESISKNSSITASTRSIVEPIPGVPHCVSCQAHVICQPSDVHLLIKNKKQHQKEKPKSGDEKDDNNKNNAWKPAEGSILLSTPSMSPKEKKTDQVVVKSSNSNSNKGDLNADLTDKTIASSNAPSSADAISLMQEEWMLDLFQAASALSTTAQEKQEIEVALLAAASATYGEKITSVPSYEHEEIEMALITTVSVSSSGEEWHESDEDSTSVASSAVESSTAAVAESTIPMVSESQPAPDIADDNQPELIRGLAVENPDENLKTVESIDASSLYEMENDVKSLLTPSLDEEHNPAASATKGTPVVEGKEVKTTVSSSPPAKNFVLPASVQNQTMVPVVDEKTGSSSTGIVFIPPHKRTHMGTTASGTGMDVVGVNSEEYLTHEEVEVIHCAEPEAAQGYSRVGKVNSEADDVVEILDESLHDDDLMVMSAAASLDLSPEDVVVGHDVETSKDFLDDEKAEISVPVEDTPVHKHGNEFTWTSSSTYQNRNDKESSVRARSMASRNSTSDSSSSIQAPAPRLSESGSCARSTTSRNSNSDSSSAIQSPMQRLIQSESGSLRERYATRSMASRNSNSDSSSAIQSPMQRLIQSESGSLRERYKSPASKAGSRPTVLSTMETSDSTSQVMEAASPQKTSKPPFPMTVVTKVANCKEEGEHIEYLPEYSVV